MTGYKYGKGSSLFISFQPRLWRTGQKPTPRTQAPEEKMQAEWGKWMGDMRR